MDYYKGLFIKDIVKDYLKTLFATGLKNFKRHLEDFQRITFANITI